MVLILMGLVFLCGCISGGNSLPINKYVAIQEDMREDSTLISGSVPYRHGPPPTPIFYYNKDILKTIYKSESYPPEYPPMNESLKILLGTYRMFDRTQYMDISFNVSGIYGYPYKLDSGLIILNVDENGTVQMEYDNKPIYLGINETWVSPIVSTRYDTLNGTHMNTSYSYTVKYTTSCTVTNKGIFDK